MIVGRRQIWPTLTLAVTMLSTARSGAQVGTALTDQDRAEIRALSTAYGPALFGCKGEEYADLFATPGGYFGSSSRGEVSQRQALIEMVLSYDRCRTGPATTAATADPGRSGRRSARHYPSSPRLRVGAGRRQSPDHQQPWRRLLRRRVREDAERLALQVSKRRLGRRARSALHDAGLHRDSSTRR